MDQTVHGLFIIVYQVTRQSDDFYELLFIRKTAGDCKPSVVTETIESGVRVVREGVSGVYNAASAQKQHVENFVSTGKAHSQCEYIY